MYTHLVALFFTNILIDHLILILRLMNYWAYYGNMLLIYGNIHSVGYDENIFYLHDITL